METSILYEQRLGIFPQQPDLATLTNKALFWREKREQRLALSDVVGVSLIEKNNIPCLLVHAYPIVTGNFFKKPRRTLTEYCFTCPNLEVRSQWQKAIKNALVGKLPNDTVTPKHLQIIINPVSGKKQASRIFEDIRPLFDKSFLTYSVTQTYSTADTKELVSNLNLSEIDGLVIVGGDGTVHDAIASLTTRPDWKKAIKLPIGVIPGGTGNGLSKTLLELSGETYDPLNAAFLIAKGKQHRLDLALVKQKNTKYYSFLSLAWGLIGDVDIKSEKLKFLGSLRFDLYSLILICLLRTYRGKFSFIPHPDCQTLPEITRRGKWHIIEDDFIFLWAMNTPWAAHDMNVTPHASLNDGAIDILIMRKGTSRLELLKALLRCGKGKHLDLPHMEYYKVVSFRLEPLTPKGLLIVDGEVVDYSPIQMQIVPSLGCVNG